MPFVKVPLEFFDLDEVQHYVDLSGDWSAGLPIRALCLAGISARRGSPEGRLAGPPEVIEMRMGWRGRKGQGLEALLQAGLIEEVEGGFRIKPSLFSKFVAQVLIFKLRARKAAKALHGRSTIDATSTA